MKPATALILLFIFSFLFGGGGCATLPPIVPDNSTPLTYRNPAKEIDILFPPGSFQFVHSLELTLPGNHSAMLMGVLNVHSQSRTLHCIVMTLEGLILFEADYTSKGLTIQRGIPPFDSLKFALGLIRDIQLAFFRPSGRLLASGRFDDGLRIFRFSETGNGTIDVISSRDRLLWTLNARNRNHRLGRTIRYQFSKIQTKGAEFGFPETITLTAKGLSRYTLIMTLIDAHLIPDSNLSR